jgi:hypothetical protein
MVEARRNEDKVEERHDLLSSLLDATQDELGSEAALDDDELIGEYQTPRSFGILGKRLIRVPGNMFIYLLAGHEVGIFPFFLQSFTQTVPYRPLHMHYASHLPCWLFILMSKSVCINISKASCPALMECLWVPGISIRTES